jgi:uncharacterized protein
MARPGVEVRIIDTPPTPAPDTDTGKAFVVGTSEQGPQAEAVLITSIAQFVERYGARASYSLLYDWLDVYFREGGQKAYVCRVVGPNPVKAGVTLNDGAAAPTLRVQMTDPGAFGNAYNAAILAGDIGGQFKIQITHDTLGTIATSPSFEDKTAAFNSAWAELWKNLFTLVDQASLLDPAVVAATSMTGGTDDRSNVTDAQWQNALDFFPRDLGPGQVASPGRTTTVGQTQLLAHAGSRNRRALIDIPDGQSKANLDFIIGTLLAATVDEKYGAVFYPWAKAPGVVLGTQRDVPYSAVQAGLIARSDGVGNSPNAPAAGEAVFPRYITSLKQTFTDAEREALNAEGVNIAIKKFGRIRTYGYRTLVADTVDPNWADFGNSRYFMSVVARGEVIAERYMFREIDGRGITINAYGGDLTAMLRDDYERWNSLYGATFAEAASVDVGPGVNTPETIANRQLKARCALRVSPFAELVVLELSKVLSNERVS